MSMSVPVEGGYRLAKWVFEKGCKTLIEVDGMPGSAPADERRDGLYKAMKEYPGTKILAARPATGT